MKVREVMTKEVKACAAHDSLETAARIMWENDCGCVPVLEGATVVGMITDRDICMAAYTQGRGLAEMTVANARSGEAFTCRDSDDLAHAEALMRHRKVRRLPVVDESGKLAGIISLADIARAAELEAARRYERRVTDTEVARILGAIAQPHGSLSPAVWPNTIGKAGSKSSG